MVQQNNLWILLLFFTLNISFSNKVDTIKSDNKLSVFLRLEAFFEAEHFYLCPTQKLFLNLYTKN